MKLRLEYSSIFDAEIACLTGDELDDKLTASVEAFLPELDQQWMAQGQPLVDLAIKLSGLTFKQNEARCTLTVSSFVSMSHPLIVNVKKYIGTSDIKFLNEVIFHEVLHVLLTDNWKVWPTNLIKKHSNENKIVAAHLHLMSIERAIHLGLKNHHHLEAIGRWYQKMGGGYELAWATICKDGLDKEFLEELRDGSQWGLRP